MKFVRFWALVLVWRSELAVSLFREHVWKNWTQVPRRGLEVDMRVCPNTGCVAFGRIVFSVATRCPLCRWDLKAALPASETGPQPKPDQHLPSPR